MIYTTIVLNVTFLLIDVKNGIQRIIKIIKYYKGMRKRSNEIAVHNYIVDELGSQMGQG
jgi:hypothetical protein